MRCLFWSSQKFGYSLIFRKFNFRHRVALRKLNPDENNRLYGMQSLPAPSLPPSTLTMSNVTSVVHSSAPILPSLTPSLPPVNSLSLLRIITETCFDGYHFYSSIWYAKIGEQVHVVFESRNECDSSLVMNAICCCCS